MASRRVYRGRKFWARTVQDWEASGKSQRQFAESRGISPSTLSKWAKLFGERAADSPPVPALAEPAFVEVTALPTAPDGAVGADPALRLRFGDVVAEFPQLPLPVYLAAVVQHTVGGRC